MFVTSKHVLYIKDVVILLKFPKILQNLSEGHMNVGEHFPKISEDKRRSPKT